MQSFRQYLFEYYISEMQDIFPKERINEYSSEAEQIRNFNNGIKLLKYTFDKNNLLFILTKDETSIGHLFIQKYHSGQIWSVIEVFLDDNQRGKGLAKLLYSTVLELNIDLMNGKSLSKKAEYLWKSLITTYPSATYDAEEDKYYKTDDKPSKDTIKPYEGEQRFFWVISKSKLL